MSQSPQDPRDLAAAAIAAAARFRDAEDLRQRIAAAHNLPPALAEFLRGDDALALDHSAHRLAVAVGLEEPTK